MFHIPPELNGMVDLDKVKVSYAIAKLYSKWSSQFRNTLSDVCLLNGRDGLGNGKS